MTADVTGAVDDTSRLGAVERELARRQRPGRLAKPVELERTWASDREAMLAALRVALGLPRALPSTDEEAVRR